jgi:vancomycin resistance protein YoaR
VVVGGVVAGAGLLYLGLVMGNGSDIPAGTTVLGVDIGGKSTAEATTTLGHDLRAKAKAPLVVTANGERMQVTPAKAGLSFDAAATASAASASRWNPMVLLSRFGGGQQVDPVVKVDQAALDKAVASVAERADVPAAAADVVVTDGDPQVVESHQGVSVHRDQAAAALAAAYLRTSQPLELPIETTQPQVTTSEAQKVEKEIAVPALSGPVRVSAGGATAVIRPATIAKALTFAPKDATLVPVLDGAVLRAALAPQLRSIEKPGRDASFVIRGDKPVVVPSVTGFGVAPAALATAVTGALTATGDGRTVTVPLGTIEPALTTDQAKALGITEKLASFRQWFPPAEYRRVNVGTAAKYMNGTVLKPGDIYSMNNTIKERTPENGYVNGIRIQNGRFVEDVGGGVSIITTATWSAAFYAGLERIEQRAHSLWISRYQPGLEATVSWGELDLRFRNDTGHGVLITAVRDDGGVRITMWGTKVYDDVKAVFGPKRDVTPFKSVIDSGDGCLPSNGSDGFTIDVYREFFKGGAMVKKEKFTTVYEPTIDVTCGPQPTPSPSASPGASGSAKPAPSGSPAPSSTTKPKPATSATPKPSKT